MVNPDDSVIRIALSQGLLTPARLQAADPPSGATPDGDRRTRAVEWLVREGLVDALRLAAALSTQLGLPLVDPGSAAVAPDALSAVPRALAERANALPLSRDGPVLRVAVGDPFDFDMLDGLGHATGLLIEPSVAPADAIPGAIERHYAMGTASAPEAVGTAVESVSDEAPIVRWLEENLRAAVERRASDIHFEPLDDRMRVRWRVDGVLHEAAGPPARQHLAIVSRLKLMAGMSIAEKRRPQDGRVRLALGRRTVDLRLASLPTVHGESVVLRVLETERLQPDLAELGLHRDQLGTLDRLLGLNDGIILVTGPTGSGKTTTLYACLRRLNCPDRKIITVEDPVEYQLPGINQVAVRPAVGLTFGSALRAMLRQSPNVIMVGEIRDRETAGIAINAALTGHLVFSTLHTNDAIGAVTRLVDLGVKPYMIAAALRAALAQRLVRRLCVRCGGRPGGCPDCDHTGYRGRIGLFEILVVDAEARDAIAGNSTMARRQALRRARGPVTLRENGRSKAAAGLTSLADVLAATVEDDNEM